LFICVVDKTALKTEKNEKNEKNDFHMWFSQIEISTGQIGIKGALLFCLRRPFDFQFYQFSFAGTRDGNV
jgi:hypothetical protein